MIDRIGWHFGLEQEFFYATDLKEGEIGKLNILVPPPGIPRDNAGWLIEARGEPYTDPFDAVFSLSASIERIKQRLERGFLKKADRLQIPIRVKTECIKKYGISPKDKLIQNLYGDALTDDALEWDYAGIHINITKIKCVKGEFSTEMFDPVPIVRFLDEAFGREIDNAKRLRGSYSVKPMQRGIGLEYRSLPTTVELTSIIYALQQLKKEVLL